MEAIREWLGEIACFMCLMTVLLHVIPDTGLKKYVRFFLGILLLLVAAEPIGRGAGMEQFLENVERKSLEALERITHRAAWG